MRVPRLYTLRTGLASAIVLGSFALSQQAAGQPVDEERERALVLFDAAELRYQEARFDEAVELLIEARSLFDEAVISYNLGRAYEELEDWAEAAAAFRHYLERAEDDASDRRVVESRIRRLDVRAEEQREPDEPDEPEPDEPEPDEPDQPDGPPPAVSSGPSAGALIVTGVGAATLVTGIVFGVLSGSARGDAVSDPVHETSGQSFRDAETYATVANVSLVIGGVLAAAGLTWLFLDLALAEDDSVALRVGPGSVALTGVFP
jgi:tetratricopeptide (TPR) repeat protein